MRKVERLMAEAIRSGKRFKGRNTTVRPLVGGGFSVELHGNVIAHAEGRKPDGSLWGVTLDHCGWLTVTTKSRLNAVLAALGSTKRVYQHRHEWFVWTPSREGGQGEAFYRGYTLA
jgi:hypothetical protein